MVLAVVSSALGCRWIWVKTRLELLDLAECGQPDSEHACVYQVPTYNIMASEQRQQLKDSTLPVSSHGSRTTTDTECAASHDTRITTALPQLHHT